MSVVYPGLLIKIKTKEDFEDWYNKISVWLHHQFPYVSPEEQALITLSHIESKLRLQLLEISAKDGRCQEVVFATFAKKPERPFTFSKFYYDLDLFNAVFAYLNPKKEIIK